MEDLKGVTENDKRNARKIARLPRKDREEAKRALQGMRKKDDDSASKKDDDSVSTGTRCGAHRDEPGDLTELTSALSVLAVGNQGLCDKHREQVCMLLGVDVSVCDACLEHAIAAWSPYGPMTEREREQTENREA